MATLNLFSRLRIFFRSRRWLYPVLTAAIVFMALALLVLLAAASGNTEFFDQYFSLLYKVNLVVGMLLILIISVLLITLFVRWRQHKFGARLMAKLALFFAVVGVLPGGIIYLVSYQFVSRSIESWFDVKVETALDAGLNLGRTAMNVSLTDLKDKTRVMAEQWATGRDQSEGAPANNTLLLARLREQFGVETATVITASGKLVANASSRDIDPIQESPTPSMLAQAQKENGYAAIEEDDSSDLSTSNASQATVTTTNSPPNFRLRSVVRVPGFARTSSSGLLMGQGHADYVGEPQYLQVIQGVSKDLAKDAENVQNAYREYQEKALGRSGLRKMYIGTLTLTLFLAVFVAMMLALLLGSQLARPLLLLLQGTKEVAEGNLSPKRVLSGNDELGQLTQHFSQMTRQLAEARGAVEENRTALEDSKAYLESILSNLTAGVFVFDHEFCLTTANAGAERIFKRPFTPYLGSRIEQISALGEFAPAIRQAFTDQEAQTTLLNTKGTADHWQKQLAVEIPGETEPLVLLARGTHLSTAQNINKDVLSSSQNERGYVVVFDDISDVIAAQRSIAWGEVARRLAHEIKNPLTPIQLSAERLQMKLEDKLTPQDAEILRKGAGTIVSQVSAMKRMVDDFRDYARLPPAAPTAIQLNNLIVEVLHLYGVETPQLTGFVGSQNIQISAQLDSGLPQILGDSTQLRQVIHNLVQNAQDSVADNLLHSRDKPCVQLQTEAVEYKGAEGRRQQAVRLTIRDNGAGFAPRVLNRAFEPYVTTKAKGTGLGLAMVKKIVDEHGAKIEIGNLHDHLQTSSTLQEMTVEYKDSNKESFSGSGAQISILFLKLAEAV